MLLLWLDPTIAKGVLGFLAETQATTVNPLSDAQPGKILHETRNGEMARLGEVPFRHLLRHRRCNAALCHAGWHVFRPDRRHCERSKRSGRISRRLCNGSTHLATPMGTALSNMRARPNLVLSIKAGRIPTIRFSMPMVTWRVARSRFARCRAMCLPPRRYAASLASSHGRVMILRPSCAARRKFCKRISKRLFGARRSALMRLALDGGKKPCRVRTSNAGHALFTGIASPERARRVADDIAWTRFFQWLGNSNGRQ